jgi:hypothetical protein
MFLLLIDKALLHPLFAKLERPTSKILKYYKYLQISELKSTFVSVCASHFH